MEKNQMKKTAAKSVAKALTGFLKADANSTSCVFVYQPKTPKALERFRSTK